MKQLLLSLALCFSILALPACSTAGGKGSGEQITNVLTTATAAVNAANVTLNTVKAGLPADSSLIAKIKKVEETLALVNLAITAANAGAGAFSAQSVPSLDKATADLNKALAELKAAQ